MGRRKFFDVRAPLSDEDKTRLESQARRVRMLLESVEPPLDKTFKIGDFVVPTAGPLEGVKLIVVDIKLGGIVSASTAQSLPPTDYPIALVWHLDDYIEATMRTGLKYHAKPTDKNLN